MFIESLIFTHTFVVLWDRSYVVLHNLLLEDGYDSNWEGGMQDLDRIAIDDIKEGNIEALPYN